MQAKEADAMGISLLLESMTTAAFVGMGCGSGISAVVYGYFTTHTRNIKQSLRAFIDFFSGKYLQSFFCGARRHLSAAVL